jgi:hypothetical protein
LIETRFLWGHSAAATVANNSIAPIASANVFINLLLRSAAGIFDATRRPLPLSALSGLQKECQNSFQPGKAGAEAGPFPEQVNLSKRLDNTLRQ